MQWCVRFTVLFGSSRNKGVRWRQSSESVAVWLTNKNVFFGCVSRRFCCISCFCLPFLWYSFSILQPALFSPLSFKGNKQMLQWFSGLKSLCSHFASTCPYTSGLKWRSTAAMIRKNQKVWCGLYSSKYACCCKKALKYSRECLTHSCNPGSTEDQYSDFQSEVPGPHGVLRRFSLYYIFASLYDSTCSFF